ncbi:acyl-CoA thioesterase-1 [Gemmobacter caeni]|uniref:Acyl-CoA thioesterase-1 n=1 Tax=Gemmobacter caeni TaxID=589035 RepID=A0A2T6AYQ7_9RHOB|nr:arylesterase [Gemmobacter caeni]PTX48945.1 acyl-CoA thioesterase-1 [Gemmobacter caeni]TWI99054.1 acyl-CoA thioesterase-1 [Gemmobacter caeni]
MTVLPAGAEPVTVVALGDSLTAGYGLPEGEGLVPQLQGWLRAQGSDAVVVNAGVSGDTTAGGLARLDWSLTPETDALIVTLGGNDLLRGLDPATTRANLDAILAKAQARNLPVLLIGLPGPANFGPEWKAEFDAIYPDLAAKYDTLLVPDFMAGLGSHDPAALRGLMQGDGIHPNAEGVDKIVATLGPEVLALIARAKP